VSLAPERFLDLLTQRHRRTALPAPSASSFSSDPPPPSENED
jgi:hypothetical protein